MYFQPLTAHSIPTPDMRKHLLCLTFLFLAVIAAWQPCFAQINADEYTLSRNVELNLQGEYGSYRYIVDHMEGRFNRQLKRFEFRMPLEGVKPQRNPADFSMLKSVFLFSPEATIGRGELVQLWVYLPDETRNFNEYRHARVLTLPADFIVNGNTYRTPVAMRLFYSAGSLKYGLDMNLKTPLVTASSVSNTGGVPFRKLQMLVKDSDMNIYFGE